MAAFEATVKVSVEVPEPGAAMEAGLKATVTPEGWPLAVKAIAESKPPETVVVTVEVPLAPCATETAPGEADSVKAGTGGGGPEDPDPEEPQPPRPSTLTAVAAKTTNIIRKLLFILAPLGPRARTSELAKRPDSPAVQDYMPLRSARK